MSDFVFIDGDAVNRQHIVRVHAPRIENDDTFSVLVVLSSSGSIRRGGFGSEDEARDWIADLTDPLALFTEQRDVRLVPRTEQELVAYMRDHLASGGTL